MIYGQVSPGFEPIAEAFERGHAGDLGGAQLCVYQEGRVVVDLWTGSDPETGVAIDGDSLFVLWSTTKGMVAIIAAMLIEQGHLDPEQPVAQVWPEFGVRGKEPTTVAHFLSHAAGLPFFPSAAGIESGDLPNWELCVETLAAAEPLWAPGTASWYHPFTFGYLNGEVIRRVTGTSLSELFAERVARPLGVDFWIGGLPPLRETEVTHRRPLNVSPTTPADVWARHGVDLSDPAVAELLEQMQSIPDMAEFLNTAEGHQMEFGGAGGIASARSVAKVYAATIGEIDSVRLLSPQTLDFVTRPRTSGLGPVPQLATVPDQKLAEFGLGFWLGSQRFPSERFASGGTFGHPGMGGIRGFAHPESNMAVAYTCTGMWLDDSRPDPRVAWAEPLADLAGA
jgi:CubicO group peptidase (beta-lactamase class C family)